MPRVTTTNQAYLKKIAKNLIYNDGNANSLSLSQAQNNHTMSSSQSPSAASLNSDGNVVQLPNISYRPRQLSKNPNEGGSLNPSEKKVKKLRLVKPVGNEMKVSLPMTNANLALQKVISDRAKSQIALQNAYNNQQLKQQLLFSQQQAALLAQRRRQLSSRDDFSLDQSLDLPDASL